MKTLADGVLTAAIVIFIFVGVCGVTTSWFEFRWMYPVEIAGPEVTVLNQQRFLKSLELAWGIGLLLVRRQIFVVPETTRMVLFLFSITPFARLVSMSLDGWPHPHFVALVCVEITAAGILWAHALQTGSLATDEPGRSGSGARHREERFRSGGRATAGNRTIDGV